MIGLKGFIMSLFEILLIQLSMPSLYSSIKWLQIKNRGGLIKWALYLTQKIQRDGFLYYLKKRRNLLITQTLCSLSNMANSRNACTVIGLFELDENRWNLSNISQRIDMMIHWLNIFGIVCPQTGRNIGVFSTNVEDTGSLEKTLGKDHGKGYWRWCFSRFGNIIHHQRHFTIHVPISIDAAFCHNVWKKFYKNDLYNYYISTLKLNPEKSYLMEFAKSNHQFIHKNEKNFAKLNAYINGHKSDNYGIVTNWYGCKSIYSFGVDGLHMCLRVINFTIKCIILFAIDYCNFLRKNPNMVAINHPYKKNYKIMETDALLKHFKECCEIPLHYDKDSPGRSSIRAGVCIFFHIIIYKYNHYHHLHFYL